MVKMAWVAVAFALGLALGVFIGRVPFAASAPEPELAAQTPAKAASASTSPYAPAEAQASPTTRPARAANTPPAPVVPSAFVAAAAPADESQVSQPIDVGPVFAKQFTDTTAQGYRDSMAEAHRALERETRDDSWAYPMEAEIENSLVADTSMGNFKKEHIECRATMCEVRLTARGEAQAAALQKWNDGLHSQPWNSRLLMSSSSVSNTDNNVDALMIFTRPPPAPPGKN